MTNRMPWVRCAGLLLLGAVSVSAQVADQVLVYVQNSVNILRFDRNLTLLGTVDLQPSGELGIYDPPAIDGHGRAWIPFAGPSLVQRIAADGTVLPSATLQHTPLKQLAAADGRVFCLSRAGLSAGGPVYCMSGDGAVLWSNWAGPKLFQSTLPQNFAVTTTGELWMGCETAPPHKYFWQSRIARISPDDGSVIESYWLPDKTKGIGDEVFADLEGDIDGTMWINNAAPAILPAAYMLRKTDGRSILQEIPLMDSGGNIWTGAVRVDGAGKLYVTNLSNDRGAKGNLLLRFNPASPEQPEATYTFGDVIIGYALGADGDDAFAVIAKFSEFPARRLERMNLVTGRKSSILLESWFSPSIPYGDVTGFVYANINDRGGDNDGDGIPNGDETAARSNPFDPLSRPDGPKVFIDFAPTTNAPVLIFQDPDGLLDPQKGLDLSKLSLKVGNYGEVFSFLLPFLTAVSVSPDGTQATATFGLLHLASNTKLKFEARVTDLTGAEGWDFQVSPPGDL